MGDIARSASEILRQIDTFSPAGGNWLPLDRLLDELWQQDVPASAIPVLLGVFERFPDDDGAGVFWSILHGLEARDDYEHELRASVDRCPSLMAKTMLKRLEKSQST